MGESCLVRVAVYSIAKNEEQFIHRWADSAKDADLILLADTGSTDNTMQIAMDRPDILPVSIVVNPWRFDEARNKALAMIGEDYDYCIALDIDEVLLPGWRDGLERAHKAGVTRPRYKYVWSWNPDGTEGLVYGGDKIHARNEYYWKHPVHEVLICSGVEKQDWYSEITIHHFPDHSKPRSQYLPLLELAVAEDPDDDRNAFYYARELYFYGQHEKATEEFKRHLSLPSAQWPPERARSMRYLAELEDRRGWLLAACGECPDRREGWVDLAQMYYEQQDWQSCLAAAERALEIAEKPLEYLCEEHAWGALPWDLAAIAAYNLGERKKAEAYGAEALALAPDDARLARNMEFYGAGIL